MSWIHCLESHQAVVKVLVMAVISSGVQGPESLFSGCGLGIILTFYRPLLDLCTMITSTGSSRNGHLLLYGQQENFSTFKATVRA